MLFSEFKSLSNSEAKISGLHLNCKHSGTISRPAKILGNDAYGIFASNLTINYVGHESLYVTIIGFLSSIASSEAVPDASIIISEDSITRCVLSTYILIFN